MGIKYAGHPNKRTVPLEKQLCSQACRQLEAGRSAKACRYLDALCALRVCVLYAFVCSERDAVTPEVALQQLTNAARP